ncbi:MAG: T9SS type A sorting domain-containing protein [Bernardetiaceae bacterium]|jgi:hypothetical protein|nr:T9SS type A sorting domain-containing protein [Bernardetiaceae bacterium]
MKQTLLTFIVFAGIFFLTIVGPVPGFSSPVAWAQTAPLADDDKLHEDANLLVSNIYPNPATDQITFDYLYHNPQIVAKITIRNVLGGVVAEFQLDKSERTVSLPVAHYAAGIYFYTLTIDNKSIVTKKLIIKR